MTMIQKLALAIAIFGFLAGAGAQLSEILAPLGAMAPLVVKEIVSIAGFSGGILGVVMSFISGQSSIVKTVQEMPGVEKITVNAKANQTLATLAVDPAQDKIEPTPQAQSAVEQTAKGDA